MTLIITEKPSVAKSIASALGVTSRADGYFEGGDWLISWCIGHLVGLADAAAYDDRYKKWRYEDLPILPDPFRYVVSEEKAAQFHILRSLMERPDVTELVNACDAGREGELIFRLVYEAAGCSKPFSRLWISSMEDAAIREGFADLRPGADYDPLYQSALCRQKADWLIGINASRLFSVLYHRALNVGRVQTPHPGNAGRPGQQDRPVPQGEISSCATGAGGSRGGQRPHCFPGGRPGHPGRL